MITEILEELRLREQALRGAPELGIFLLEPVIGGERRTLVTAGAVRLGQEHQGTRALVIADGGDRFQARNGSGRIAGAQLRLGQAEAFGATGRRAGEQRLPALPRQRPLLGGTGRLGHPPQ